MRLVGKTSGLADSPLKGGRARSSSSSSDGACVFPGEWSGDWFQSKVAETIRLDASTISTKGECVRELRDAFPLAKMKQYIVHNR